MAYVFNRGTKAAPSYRGRYRDADGKWQWTRVPAEFSATEKKAQKWVDELEEGIQEGKPDPRRARPCGELMEKWLKTLENRNKADDEWRTRKHLLPRFKNLTTTQLTRAEVVRWLRELRATEPVLSVSSQKNLFGLLSRFCAWLCADDTIPSNPCRDVPRGEKPKAKPRDKSRSWLDDEEKTQALIFALGPRWGLAFAVCNRAGLRAGEAMGLRVADVDLLEAEGVLHVAHSFDGRVKEDRGGEKPTDKHPPLHDATVAAALLWQAKGRREAGARDEDRLFGDWLPATTKATKIAYGRAWLAAVEAVNSHWRGESDEVREREEIRLSWYESTRHTAASRALKNGARFEEVSAMLNHSSPTITARFYNRHSERSYATIPATNIGTPVQAAKVLPFAKAGAK